MLRQLTVAAVAAIMLTACDPGAFLPPAIQGQGVVHADCHLLVEANQISGRSGLPAACSSYPALSETALAFLEGVAESPQAMQARAGNGGAPAAAINQSLRAMGYSANTIAALEGRLYYGLVVGLRSLTPNAVAAASVL